MISALEILKKFWGYEAFRPLQKEIIDSITQGFDTLAILPTGGGKSICFQVPALMQEGVCVVVTPLIALMQDQVHQLKRRGIPATAIFSGMSKQTIDYELDNCIYGEVKFLYVSPERLKTELFIHRAKKMKICLLAIDEAHCISQWGYDFRPPYLEILHFRQEIGEIPCIALTASATQKVRDDIVERLNFKNFKVFVKSFARKNLSYSSLHETTKSARLLSLLEKVPGTAIVYVRSRERAESVANLLTKKGISADFYHAGLTPDQRTERQKNWISNKTRVIAATNAFGMGIDKPDVRLVVHLDLPESIEAYYQEAGRAGRDEKPAYAVILYNQDDITKLRESQARTSPAPEILENLYQKLANYFKIAMGSGRMASFEFMIDEFAKYADYELVRIYYALRRMGEVGLIHLDDPGSAMSRIKLNVSKIELYTFEVAYPSFKELLDYLQRRYEGVFSQMVEIDEKLIAKHLSQLTSKVISQLCFLEENGILTYEKRLQNFVLTFLENRQAPAFQGIFKEKLMFLYQRNDQQIRAVIDYVENNNSCRTSLILKYFDEKNQTLCGICDYCVAEKKKSKYTEILPKIKGKILTIVEDKKLTINDLKLYFSITEQDIFHEALRQLSEAGKIRFDNAGLISKK